MNQLEALINSLIKMGWKPFGMEINAEHIDRIVVKGPTMHIIFKGDGEYVEGLRALVSLESGLWQFCVKKELTRGYDGEEWKYTEIFPGDYRDYPADEHQYRLIESVLIPEEELGQFLVDNIIVEGKKE